MNSNSAISPRVARRRSGNSARLAVLSVAAVAAVGVTTHQLNQPAEPASEAMSAIPTPCDGFMDCIYTAYWYAFLR